MHYIWTDAIDKNMVHFGIQYKINQPIYIHFSCHIDGVFDLWGKDISDQIQAKPQGLPIEIKYLDLIFE